MARDKAQYVHYRIFDKPDSTDLPPVDGVRNGKCEYGIEILITLAYLVYRKQAPREKPVLGPFVAIIHEILEADRKAPPMA
jgi:hypothetical protein